MSGFQARSRLIDIFSKVVGRHCNYISCVNC